MSTKSKAKGTTAERDVVKYLHASGWPAAERRALSGNKDKGDVAGIPGVCIEVKAQERPLLAQWARELAVETVNAGASFGLLVVKRPYKPVSRWDAYMTPEQAASLAGGLLLGPGRDKWVSMDLRFAVALMRSAGY